MALTNIVVGSDDWITVGKALQSLGWPGWTFAAWNKWSKDKLKGYTDHTDLEARWKEWGDHDVTINELFDIAREHKRKAGTLIEPLDFWAKRQAPELPRGLLPKVIEDYAFNLAEIMGCDPAGLAMSALTVCSAAISDSIKVKLKVYDEWAEATRIWMALAGPVSAIKSPQMGRAAGPLMSINNALSREYANAMGAYNALSSEEKKETEKPKHKRMIVEDTTPEGAQPIMRDSPDGLLMVQDEMSGWLCSMEKYSGKGAGADRGFWLKSFNGRAYTWDRANPARGSGYIPNFSLNLLGAIQEELLRDIGQGEAQRWFPRTYEHRHPASCGGRKG